MKQWASNFSDENGEPDPRATLVLRVHHEIKNPPDSTSEQRRRHAVRHPFGRKMLALAMRHLAENPEGHVAFGCRLGHDRSKALADELTRRMQAKEQSEAQPVALTVSEILQILNKETA